MLVAGVVVAILVGYLRKGKISNFEYVKIKLWYLVTVAFLIQFISINAQFVNDRLFYLLHLLSYVIIMSVFIINRHLFSVWIIGAGHIMNFIVIAFNDGKMPVRMTERIMTLTGGNPYFDRGHMMLTEMTKFKIFADLFVLDVPVIPISVFSIGDVLLVVGIFILVQKGMLAKSEDIE